MDGFAYEGVKEIATSAWTITNFDASSQIKEHNEEQKRLTRLSGRMGKVWYNSGVTTELPYS